LDMAIEKAMRDKREPLMLDRFVNLCEHLKSEAHVKMPGYIANMSQEPVPPDLSTANMMDKLIDAAYEHLLVPALHDVRIPERKSTSNLVNPFQFAHLYEEGPEVAKRREDLKHQATEIEDAIRELGSLVDMG